MTVRKVDGRLQVEVEELMRWKRARLLADPAHRWRRRAAKEAERG